MHGSTRWSPHSLLSKYFPLIKNPLAAQNYCKGVFTLNYLKIRKKSFILLISYLSFGIIALCGMVYASEQRSAYYERSINAGYTRAFAELSADVAELDMSLQKALYSTSPALLSTLCSNIYGKANAAQTSMAELPFSDYTLENATAFITRTGDFAYALSRKVSGGAQLSSEEYSALQQLSDAATILSQNLIDMQSELENGTMHISDLVQTDINTDDASALLGDRFQMVENEFPEIPTLVYDGPFSQHINTSSPKLLEGMSPVSRETALKNAAAFIGIAPNELSYEYEVDGEIPLYCFSNSDGSISISVTKHGGKIYNMSKYRTGGSTAMSADNAVSLAKDFLASHGFENLKDSYWTMYDGILLVNFAATDGDYICYPDLVKAEVSLDTGEIVGFEAAGYITNHSTRNLPEKIIDGEKALEMVSPALSIMAENLCIIPTSGKNEVYCYEFKCENARGDHYLVYVNAESGEQEKIIRLIESENGTLTM